MSALQSSPVEVMRHHPCFDEQAHEQVGRVHLPVAPRCNIQCAFCERRICANLTMQHPGWAYRLLSPSEAVEQVRRLVHSQPGAPFVVGVAGPGEPLANAETFAALARIHQEHPALMKCVSTNGLLLEQTLPRILAAGITALTVTVNAPDEEIGQRIYSWIRHQGRIYRGKEAAKVLLASQLRGIQAALDAGLALKVNTVLIPDVNDQHMVPLARRLKTLGVPLMNIIPLIPSGQMKEHRGPTRDELTKARFDCEEVVPQFRRCEQCRADVVRFPLCSDARRALGFLD